MTGLKQAQSFAEKMQSIVARPKFFTRPETPPSLHDTPEEKLLQLISVQTNLKHCYNLTTSFKSFSLTLNFKIITALLRVANTNLVIIAGKMLNKFVFLNQLYYFWTIIARNYATMPSFNRYGQV